MAKYTPKLQNLTSVPTLLALQSHQSKPLNWPPRLYLSVIILFREHNVQKPPKTSKPRRLFDESKLLEWQDQSSRVQVTTAFCAAIKQYLRTSGKNYQLDSSQYILWSSQVFFLALDDALSECWPSESHSYLHRSAAEETLSQRDAVRYRSHHPETKTICYWYKALFI